MTPLGEALRREMDRRSREGATYTQSDLAREMGVSRQAVSGWMSGRWGVSPRIALALEAWSAGRLSARDLITESARCQQPPGAKGQAA